MAACTAMKSPNMLKPLSEGQLILTEGALYPTLHKLESEGFVVTEKESIGKRVRKYYSLTPSGKTASSNKIEEFEGFIQMMRLVLGLKNNISMQELNQEQVGIVFDRLSSEGAQQ